jgi:hypothetical protein
VRTISTVDGMALERGRLEPQYEGMDEAETSKIFNQENDRKTSCAKSIGKRASGQVWNINLN